LAFALVVAALAGQGIIYPFVTILAYKNPNLKMIRPYFSRDYPIDQD
jgi:hypothetical protein